MATSTAGARGGFRLARPLERITLMDVVAAIEGPDDAFQCTEIRRRGAGPTRPSRRSRARARCSPPCTGPNSPGGGPSPTRRWPTSGRTPNATRPGWASTSAPGTPATDPRTRRPTTHDPDGCPESGHPISN
ncbi:Rrf2 family transcriptional regulator [Actinomadura yumaensis]|uniref:Rrf2 family transcriptional regulator n=1 Tax=Actinomadura yumaensis TaxID=111807 RepID=UPI003621854D